MARYQDGEDEWDDEDWDLLLDSVQEQTVIPIIGRDLLLLEPPDAPAVMLYEFLARRLAEDLLSDYQKVRANPPPALAGFESVCPSLNDVICWYHDSPRPQSMQGLMTRLKKALAETEAWAPPSALRHLAEIFHFPFFVTTTFDSSLERALGEVSLEGRPRHAQHLAYNPSPRGGETIGDLPNGDPAWNPLSPLVYHLMGRVDTVAAGPSSAPVVLSDEDLLDFVCALNSDNKERPPLNLLNEMASHNLLFLGCNFTDWLARLFLRATKKSRERLKSAGSAIEYVVDSLNPSDENLVIFVQQFHPNVQFYRTGKVREFVAELHRRWKARNPKAPVVVEPAAPLISAAPAKPQLTVSEEMPRDGIFISYPWENQATVLRLYRELMAEGLPVWFDIEGGVRGGESVGGKIEQAIKRARVFMPVISQHTESRLVGTFRGEWNIANQFSLENHAPEYRFFWPVCTDDTDYTCARVPKSFLVNWHRLPDGGDPAEVEARRRSFSSLVADLKALPGLNWRKS